ncbi:glycosyltransferase [Schaalia sp. Marseille-Q2122]|uniref:glycosyltransferase n=1 Tax=Schaalia sp. Marseille-Q2122 TaxID=2736604 RepID=UPI00158BF906|nr:glycosyltransferase [Schaalia sp. Marseille-Q2122]
MPPSKPRLLVLASTFPARPNDGIPAFVQDLAQAQSAEFDVRVLVPRVPHAPRTEVSPAGVTVTRFAYFPRRWEDLADGAIIENLRARPSRWLQVLPFLVAEAWAIRKEIRHFRPHAIHAHWIIPQGFIATLIAPRVPRVVTSLGGDLYALRAAPLRAAKSWVLSRAGAVTAVNTDMTQTAIDLGAPQEICHTIPMGADLDRFSPQGRPLGKSGRLNLLFVGRLVEKKGLSVLLRTLREHGTHMTLTVVGDGPLRAQLEREAQGLPVTFKGQRTRDQLAEDYRSHDVIVVPSVPAASGDQDGLPVALLEAMGTGCPVIASNLPGLNEAVIHGSSGLLVEPRDTDELGAALERLRDDLDYRQLLAEGAAQRAQLFSVEATAERYCAIIHDIIKKAPTDSKA